MIDESCSYTVLWRGRMTANPSLQVSQLGQVAQKYQAATQNGASSLSAQEVQNSCNL